MAIATNTTEGDILIGGDLDPTSTGDMPLLRASGVTPGAYNYSAVGVDGEGNSIIKITKAVIDPKGRITYAKSENYTITSVVATSSTFGIVKVDGTSVTVADGVISSITGSLPVATSTTLGAVKPDNTTVTISGNTLSVNIPAATSSTLGGVRYDNVTMYNGTDGTASVYTATNAIKGLAKPDDVTLKIEDGKLALAKATPYSNGIAKVDAITITFSGTGSSRIFRITTASDTDFGKVRPDNSTITVNNGILSTPIIYATSSTLGVAKADEITLSVENDGILTLKKSSAAIKGVARPDNTTMSINSGILSLNAATIDMMGIVKVDGTTIQSNLGTVNVPQGTTTIPGIIVPDNSTLVINSDGVLSVPPATFDKAGVVRTSNAFLTDATSVDANGIVSIDSASDTHYGVVKSDNVTTRIADGIADIPYASSTVKGLVSTGTSVYVLSDGTISQTVTLPTATQFAVGKVKTDGLTLDTDVSGTLSANIATDATPGVVSFDDNFAIISGNKLSVPNLATRGNRVYTATQIFQEQYAIDGTNEPLGSVNNNSNNLKLIADTVNRVVDGFTGDAKIGAQYTLRLSKTSNGVNIVFPPTSTNYTGGFAIEGGSLLSYDATQTLFCEMVVIDKGGQPFGLIYNQQVI